MSVYRHNSLLQYCKARSCVCNTLLCICKHILAMTFLKIAHIFYFVVPVIMINVGRIRAYFPSVKGERVGSGLPCGVYIYIYIYIHTHMCVCVCVYVCGPARAPSETPLFRISTNWRLVTKFCVKIMQIIFSFRSISHNWWKVTEVGKLNLLPRSIETCLTVMYWILSLSTII